MQKTAKQIERMQATLSSDLHAEVTNLRYDDSGFTFTVPTELDAYKAAYKYRYADETSVFELVTDPGMWRVRIVNRFPTK